MDKLTTPDLGIYPKFLVFFHPGVEIDHIEAVVIEESVGDAINLEEVNDFCFVLKPIKDKHARIAMAAYAESVKYEKPKLSHDIYEVLSDF